MKTTRILLIFLLCTLVFSCKRNEKGDVANVIEDTTVSRLPNQSDEHFSEALGSLDNDNNEEAAMQLVKGIAELKKEGEKLNEINKSKLDRAINALNEMATDLKNGKKVSTNSLREMIANAEINVAHDYLSTDNVYVLDEPEEAVTNRTRRHFDRSLSNLKEKEGKMKPEAKKEGEALLKEGEKLDDEYKNWEKKIEDYNKKANEHFKKNYPDFYEESYWLY